MFSITAPQANAIVPSTSFDVAGTCMETHQVTIRLTMPSTGQYHDYFAQAAQGNWQTTVFPWSPGPYRITAVCTGMPDAVPVDVIVEASVTPPGTP